MSDLEDFLSKYKDIMFREDGNVYLYGLCTYVGGFFYLHSEKATDILRIYCTYVHLNADCNFYFYFFINQCILKKTIIISLHYNNHTVHY